MTFHTIFHNLHLITVVSIVVVGRGGKGGMHPGRYCAGAAFAGAKIWNSESWSLLANWHLHLL